MKSYTAHWQSANLSFFGVQVCCYIYACVCGCVCVCQLCFGEQLDFISFTVNIFFFHETFSYLLLCGITEDHGLDFILGKVFSAS